jgi:hypothetical protein
MGVLGRLPDGFDAGKAEAHPSKYRSLWQPERP